MSAIKYRPAIDGMRAIAVLAVLVFHLKESILPGGFVGVDVFFVISGYLITTIVYTENNEGTFSFSRFYQRRIARIFPVFFLVTLVILMLASMFYTHQDFASAGILAAVSALSLTNMKLMMQGSYFEISPDAQPFLHFWSLSVEEQFYMFLPLFIVLMYKVRFSPRNTLLLIGAITLASFGGSIILTSQKPAWAYYLLPTRAWELLAGSFLGVYVATFKPSLNKQVDNLLGICGLVCIMLSLLFINGEMAFPGYIAALPVVGTILLLGFQHDSPHRFTERWLSHPALIFIGKASYSLYLWHWPVYCFVDYSLFTLPFGVRLVLKVTLTVAVSLASYMWFEKPVRYYLNADRRQTWGYAGFAVCIVAFVIAGFGVRFSYYINAKVSDVAQGGIAVNATLDVPALVLMGDSNGSMYGKMIKDFAQETGVKANILSVSAYDPFPGTTLYNNSIEFISSEKPHITIFAAAWSEKIGDNRGKLTQALEELLRHTQHVILITQPPILPESGSREAIRRDGVQPILEEHTASTLRKSTNDFLHTLQSERISIIDIEDLFMQADGQIRFLDAAGRQLFHDKTHLSGFGASLVSDLLRPEIEDVLKGQIEIADR